jgi:GGDEF domain-containing protein
MLTDFLNTHKTEERNSHWRQDHILPRDSQTGLYQEEYFNELLALEKKRCERSKNQMFSVFFDLSAFSDVSSRQKIAKSIMDVLSDVTRDTDVKGWHVDGLVIGIIFTETDGKEATSQCAQKQVPSKCLLSLMSRLGIDSYSRIQIIWRSDRSEQTLEVDLVCAGQP